MLLLSSVCLALPSISHAEADSKLTAKLDKLGYEQGASVERIEHYRVDGWNYIDDKHIVIYAGPSKRFLITTMNHCPDLSSAEHIGFTTTASFLTKFDKLIVRGAGGIVQHCPITEINALQKHNPEE
ncbi:MAG TPA: DUF6491 family protein [Spongiibacteraceae bacterium]|nr:DUF6491 family protein [Spongiibacteraceae bacterium]